MEIVSYKSNGLLYLNQEVYQKVFKRFSMNGAKVVSTPFTSHFLLSK